ncbi:hypothetical protein K491DRAFT_463407 [Lophiostoma macrostomum CBS 122681]|uniref:Uncharacterized protein n=1 Tax=Lophiostoma macrostomum CBS 122681 TaxID=1314788 RepID=A0A6A6SGS4_9PLEO|nr:hypothetical protein K491DRAFT_463407 [Lophiostoma macrostomum CBS 122681]
MHSALILTNVAFLPCLYYSIYLSISKYLCLSFSYLVNNYSLSITFGVFISIGIFTIRNNTLILFSIFTIRNNTLILSIQTTGKP